MNPLPDGYRKTAFGSGWAVVREDWTDFLDEMAESGSVSEFTRRRKRVMGEDERQRRIDEAQMGIATNCAAA